MPKSANQKQKLLYIRKYLRENTNQDNPVKTEKLIAYLESNGISAERKTIYDDIDQLTQFENNIDKTRGKNGGYYCYDTGFEISELKLLVDSIQSSKFVSEKQSLNLIKKLEGLTNIYDAKQLHRDVIVQNRVKTSQESVFNNVDNIFYAISNNKTIKFRYFYYDIHKKPVYKDEIHERSPFALVYDNENYYMVAWDPSAQEPKHYRVDKMSNVHPTENERQGMEFFSAKYISSYKGKVFGMYSGNEEKVKIRFENRLANVVIDQFGKDISIVPDGDEHFTINIDVQVSPQFYSWIFGLGTGCEILAPESVRDGMKAMQSKISELYK